MKDQYALINDNRQIRCLMQIILFVVCHLLVLEVSGQNRKNLFVNQPRLNWRSINVPDTSNRTFFRHHPHVSHIYARIQDDKAANIRLVFHDQNAKVYSSDSYNLNFRGDTLVFKERYRIPINWVLPKLSADYINGDYVGYTYNSYYVHIYPDSVVGAFSDNHLLLENKNYSGTGSAMTPSFVGKIQDLADSISTELVQLGYTDTSNHIVVFEGIVNKNGKLGNVERILGDSTVFSETVTSCLWKDYPDIRKPHKTMWHPGIKDGRALRVGIRIYAEIKNGKVFLEQANNPYNVFFSD